MTLPYRSYIHTAHYISIRLGPARWSVVDYRIIDLSKARRSNHRLYLISSTIDTLTVGLLYETSVLIPEVSPTIAIFVLRVTFLLG